MVNKLSPTLFTRKCDIDPVTGCWNWRSSCQTAGYGQIRISGGSWTTHRASWAVHKGPIPKGLNVLHKCDNRKCCNPEHLFLGTAYDNHHDAMAKGRHLGRFPTGAQKKPRVRKLSVEDVQRIRIGGETAKELAVVLGVGTPCIYNIRNGVRKQLW
jgi:hypothetical protein